jgi:hypothetical protein
MADKSKPEWGSLTSNEFQSNEKWWPNALNLRMLNQNVVDAEFCERKAHLPIADAGQRHASLRTGDAESAIAARHVDDRDPAAHARTPEAQRLRTCSRPSARNRFGLRPCRSGTCRAMPSWRWADPGRSTVTSMQSTGSPTSLRWRLPR